jgi:hypothetical protein
MFKSLSVGTLTKTEAGWQTGGRADGQAGGQACRKAERKSDKLLDMHAGGYTDGLKTG